MQPSVRASASVVLAAVLGVRVVLASALTIPAAGGVAVAFLASVVGAEVIAAARDDDLTDPGDAEPFRISTPVHLAAMVVAGPWLAALAGVVAVLASRLTAPRPLRELLARAVTLGVAGLAGGYAYVLAGSETGTVVLPDDVLGVCVVVAAYASVRTIVHGLAAGLGLFAPDARTLAGEGALALVLALAAGSDAWLLLAAVPTILLLEHAHHRLGVMRGEVAVALETFANIVDDRDPSTHRPLGCRRSKSPAFAGPVACTTSARSPSTRRSCASAGCSHRANGRRSGARLASPLACSSAFASPRARRRPSSTTTSDSTVPVTTASRATRFRSRLTS